MGDFMRRVLTVIEILACGTLLFVLLIPICTGINGIFKVFGSKPAFIYSVIGLCIVTLGIYWKMAIYPVIKAEIAKMREIKKHSKGLENDR